MCSSIVWQSCYVVLSSSRFPVPMFSFCPFLLKKKKNFPSPCASSCSFSRIHHRITKSDANVVQLPDTGNMGGCGRIAHFGSLCWNASGSVHWCRVQDQASPAWHRAQMEDTFLLVPLVASHTCLLGDLSMLFGKRSGVISRVGPVSSHVEPPCTTRAVAKVRPLSEVKFSRATALREIFHALDSGSGYLRSAEVHRFAMLTGFKGSPATWDEDSLG